ncbi:hypothetical protein IFM89_022446 [Coptis chinensis]|uniref:F-box domain-containing protein n=1 Tax=Coptis chinensis TaxID=261450 RepID=A0A835I6C0_9MAGN|nr:hypothetical protein IFM89_022446 [Coptis chinensis]
MENEENIEITMKNLNMNKKRTEKKVGVQNKKLEVCNEGVFPKLPVDIIFDIFSRLPLQTISNCRWVSKTWYDFILHPCLAEMHYARTSLPCSIFVSQYQNSYLIDPKCLDNLEKSGTAYNLELRT